MKKIFQNFKPSMAFMAAFFLTGAVVLPVFAALPQQNPPLGNNVDAVFSSLTAGPLKINQNGDISNVNPNNAVVVKNDGGLYVSDSSGANGFQVLPSGDVYEITNNSAPVQQGNIINVVNGGGNGGAGNGALTAPLNITNNANEKVFSVAANGDLSNPNGNSPLTFVDPQGLIVMATTGTGITSTSTTNIGGNFQGALKGISASSQSANGTGGAFTAAGGGIGVLGTSQNGTGAVFEGSTFGMSSSPNSAGGIAGLFSNKDFSASVKLATPTDAIDAMGNIKNQNLTIATNGNIFSPGGTVNITSHLKTAGIGKFVRRVGTPQNITAGNTGISLAQCNATPTEVLISCNYQSTNSSTTLISKQYANGSGAVPPTVCNVLGKNTAAPGGAALTLTSEAICFDPNN